MGYFRVNERYLRDTGATCVDPPWGVQVAAAGMVGRVRVTWRRAYSPVDGYGVQGQLGDAGEWQELLRMPGTATEAILYLGSGQWRLAVQARRGPTDSPRSEAMLWQVEGQGMGDEGWGMEVHAGAETPPSSTDGSAVPPNLYAYNPQPPIPIPTSNPHPPTRAPTSVCPVAGCGARVAVAADGSAACVYCGCRVAITLDGRALAVAGLLYGACTCCVPRRPLIRQGDGLVCPARPQQRYGVPLALGDGRNEPGSTSAPPPPGVTAEPALELDWTAIDTALRDNSAQLGRHGLFVRPRRA